MSDTTHPLSVGMGNQQHKRIAPSYGKQVKVKKEWVQSQSSAHLLVSHMDKYVAKEWGIMGEAGRRSEVGYGSVFLDLNLLCHTHNHRRGSSEGAQLMRILQKPVLKTSSNASFHKIMHTHAHWRKRFQTFGCFFFLHSFPPFLPYYVTNIFFWRDNRE